LRPIAAASAAGDRPALAAREASPWWWWLVALGAAALVAEGLLARRIGTSSARGGLGGDEPWDDTEVALHLGGTGADRPRQAGLGG
jgi:hypothetical protein